MKVFLLHRDRDFQPKPELHDGVFAAMSSSNPYSVTRAIQDRERRLAKSGQQTVSADDLLEQDLELDTLWSAMASGDEFLFEMARRVVLSHLDDVEAIQYRQQVLADCLEHRDIVLELYNLAVSALTADRQVGGGIWIDAPSPILHRSVRVLGVLIELLRRLREIADEKSAGFRSDGFTRFFAMLRDELADDYLDTVERQLGELGLKGGALESAELGAGDMGTRYVFHPPPPEPTWRDLLPAIGHRRPEEYSFEVHPRDEAGARYVAEIQGHGLNHVANAVAQSADHVQSFFVMLRLELAFYLCCLNLHAQLTRNGEPTCFPEVTDTNHLTLATEGLYDVSLTLHIEGRAVGNDLEADGKSLLMITGANQGGKSTLLRSLGLAQLMMQAGMFVGADSFRANVCTGVFTHYKREEDATMEGGKLDEELSRMSEIADQIHPGSLLLCNESFASTNEREGSEIARQVIRAMLERQIKVLFVTHLYDLAQGFHSQHATGALFLRAERRDDGSRTFKLREGEPLPTSYGEDSYRRVFGADEEPEVGSMAR